MSAIAEVRRIVSSAIAIVLGFVSFEFGVDRVKEFCCVHQAVFRLEIVQSSESTRQKVLVEVPLEVPVEVPLSLKFSAEQFKVPPNARLKVRQYPQNSPRRNPSL